MECCIALNRVSRLEYKPDNLRSHGIHSQKKLESSPRRQQAALSTSPVVMPITTVSEPKVGTRSGENVCVTGWIAVAKLGEGGGRSCSTNYGGG